MKELLGNTPREILTTIIMVLLVIVAIYFAVKQPSAIDHSTSNTKTVTTEEVTTVKNTFSIEQVTQIKRALTDSLAKVYGSIIKSLKSNDLTFNPSPFEGEGNKDSLFSYISEVDSEFVVKDDSGSVTDLLDVKSTFISPIPLDPNSVHLLKVNHTAFRKETRTDFRSYDTIYVYQSRGFWERFIISPNLSAGYGLFNKKFDLYAGIGLNFEFNAFEIFSSNKK